MSWAWKSMNLSSKADVPVGHICRHLNNKSTNIIVVFLHATIEDVEEMWKVWMTSVVLEFVRGSPVTQRKEKALLMKIDSRVNVKETINSLISPEIISRRKKRNIMMDHAINLWCSSWESRGREAEAKEGCHKPSDRLLSLICSTLEEIFAIRNGCSASRKTLVKHLLFCWRDSRQWIISHVNQIWTDLIEFSSRDFFAKVFQLRVRRSVGLWSSIQLHD